MHQMSNDGKYNTFKKHGDKQWCTDLGMVTHTDPNGQQVLDIYPVYRTLACSNASEYNEGGYHPYITEENETKFQKRVTDVLH